MHGCEPLDLVNLGSLMTRTAGRPETIIGLIDGPVAADHPDFGGSTIHEIPVPARPAATSSSRAHGTFVAGILAARRGSAAPAICPGCTLVVRPVFGSAVHDDGVPVATAGQLATALVDVVDAGARLVNLSLTVEQTSGVERRALEDALDYAARRGVVIVAAAGNDALVGASVLTRHRSVIPVAACGRQGTLLSETNLGRSVGLRGVAAPGEQIVSLGLDGAPRVARGTSAAAPFVTGCLALLAAAFPAAPISDLRFAIVSGESPRRSIVPPLLDGERAFEVLRIRFKN